MPKRGQQWSYLDRGRTFAVAMGLSALWVLAGGVYLVIIRGDWLVLVLGLVAAAGAGLLAWENERKNRVPIFDEDNEEIAGNEDAPREDPLR